MVFATAGLIGVAESVLSNSALITMSVPPQAAGNANSTSPLPFAGISVLTIPSVQPVPPVTVMRTTPSSVPAVPMLKPPTVSTSLEPLTMVAGLEAGVFVSFGPAPLVVAIDDEVFGRNRVAIAEKINESARGTARAGPARAGADQLLAAVRTARGNPGLRHAWSVFIGQPLTLSIPPDAAAEVLKAARAGDMTAAMRAVAKPVRPVRPQYSCTKPRGRISSMRPASA